MDEHYGKESNMHLHAHIKECILDFGPISAFWAFPFERFNESFSKNWVKPEEQITKKFLSFQELMAIKNIPEFSELSSFCMREDFYGSLEHTRSNPFHLSFYKKNAVCDICHVNTNYLDIHKISGKVVEKYFCDSDLDNLSGTYSTLYPNNTFTHIHRKHLLFNDLKVLGEQFTSKKSRSQRSSAIMAYWGEPALNTNNICPLKVGLVEYFFIHTLCSNNGTENEHLFAKVKWHQDHSDLAICILLFVWFIHFLNLKASIHLFL